MHTPQVGCRKRSRPTYRRDTAGPNPGRVLSQRALAATDVLRIAAIVISGCVLALASHRAFAQGFRDGAVSVLRETFAKYSVQPEQPCPDGSQCQLLLMRLKLGQLIFLSPIERSQAAKELHTYQSIRQHCRSVNFEAAEIGHVFVRARSNFALYRLLEPSSATGNQAIYIFRAEDYVSPKIADFQVDGMLVAFGYPSCRERGRVPVYKDSTVTQEPDSVQPDLSLSEIIRVENRFYVLNLSRILERVSPPKGGGAMVLFDFGRVGRDTKKSYLFSFRIEE